jgi:formylglycine-generating enzyme required for sulfatase activity
MLNYNKKIGDTTEVGAYPDGASWVGALDMAGNVWEWAKDWYADYYYATSPQENPTGPNVGYHRVLRGGSWDHGQKFVRAAYRAHDSQEGRYHYSGFRCADDPEE